MRASVLHDATTMQMYNCKVVYSSYVQDHGGICLSIKTPLAVVARIPLLGIDTTCQECCPISNSSLTPSLAFTLLLAD